QLGDLRVVEGRKSGGLKVRFGHGLGLQGLTSGLCVGAIYLPARLPFRHRIDARRVSYTSECSIPIARSHSAVGLISRRVRRSSSPMTNPAVQAAVPSARVMTCSTRPS